MTNLIETMARAICDADPLAPEPDAPIYIGVQRVAAWQGREAMARAALAAIEAAGYRVVPVEPTEAMVGVACGLSDFTLPDAIGQTPADHMREMRDAYAAMLAAAPKVIE